MPHGSVLSLLSAPLLSVSVALLAVPVQAQTSGSQDTSTASAAGPASRAEGNPHPLEEWNYQALYEQGGIRAESLLRAKAMGANGGAIGTIENAIFDEENRIVTLIAEVGGMWDSGDRHVSIPWEEVKLTEQGVQMPVHEENAAEYDLFNDAYVDDAYIFKGGLGRVTQVEDDVMTGPRIWKVTDLIDDFASLGTDTGLGYITDVLLTRDGMIQAIVVKPSNTKWGKGPYAYPFYAHPDKWQPGNMHYALPYSREAIQSLPAFDYANYDSLWE